jgi:uncharacterized membrane protein YdjX (TVP38/TMEM64 family)
MSSLTAKPPEDPNKETRRLLYLALIVAGLVAVLQFTPLKSWIADVQAWKTYVDQFGWRAHVAFVVASVLAIAVGVPRLLLALLAGALFAFKEGFALAMITGLCGSYFTFLAARGGSSAKLRERIKNVSTSVRKLLEKPSVLHIFFVRQLPVPAVVPNVLLGLVKTPHRKFLLGTFLGYLPSNAAVVALGSAFGKDDAIKALTHVSLGMAALGAVTLVIIYVRRRLETEED